MQVIRWTFERYDEYTNLLVARCAPLADGTREGGNGGGHAWVRRIASC